MSAALLVDAIVKVLVVTALTGATVVALTHWAVRRRHLQPFGRWPRLVRRVSDPLLDPVERRLVRIGRNPQDAPLWLLGLVVVGGLVLITLTRWLIGTVFRLAALRNAPPRAWAYVLVSWTFSILIAALLIRVIGSWLGMGRYSRWMRPVYALTDWLVEPIRRRLPPFGMLDLSPLVAWLALIVLRWVVLALIVP